MAYDDEMPPGVLTFLRQMNTDVEKLARQIRIDALANAKVLASHAEHHAVSVAITSIISELWDEICAVWPEGGTPEAGLSRAIEIVKRYMPK